MKVKGLFIVIFLLTISFTFVYSDDNDNNIFTEEELSWIQEHPVIKVAPEDDYAPIEFYQDGEFIGLSIDYLDWINKTYNIQFEFVYYETWTEILDALKNNDIDLQSSIVNTPARSEYMNFTEPFASVPNVVLVRKDLSIDFNIDTLFDNNVGIIKDYAVHDYIKLMYAPSNLAEYTDVRNALTDLSLGKIDALVIDLAQASYYLQDMAISNVVVHDDVKIEYEYKLSFATTKDNLILTSILNKALESMPEEKQHELFIKWIYLGEDNWVDKNLVITLQYLVGIVVLFFLIAITWSVVLKRQVKAKTRDLDAELIYSKNVASELKLLTNELEERVKERSEKLQDANEHLEESLDKLQTKDDEVLEVNRLLEEHIEVIEETQMQLIESEKLNALSRLVIGIAHEINTPLGNGITIVSYANHMIDEIKNTITFSNSTKNGKKLNNYLEQLSTSTEKALLSLQKTAKIVEEFRLVANYNYEDNIKEFYLDENINHIIQILKTHQNYKQYHFNLFLQADIKVTTSEGGFYQILLAIVENCYYHAYKETEEGMIDITLTEEANVIKLVIKDYGIGMSNDELNKIFEPFYTSTRGSKRMGLGLYAVYNIITGVLKGKISVISKFNEGTTFEITFMND